LEIIRWPQLEGTKGMAPLKERFEQFMLSEKGVESIDRLMEQCDLPDRKRADYLAFDRCAIVEQKSLDVDPVDKIQKFINEHLNGRPIGDCGQTSLEDLLNQCPDGVALSNKLYANLTIRLDKILSCADKQTRDTKRTFVNPYAVGIVVILNDNAQVLQPDIVLTKAFKMLRKQENGEIRYPHNHVVILISEAHRIVSDPELDLIPMETIYSDAGNAIPIATKFADHLKSRWAEFNGALYVDSAAHWRDVRTRDPAKVFNVQRAR